MVNKLSQRHSCENAEDYAKYVVKCPTCGTILNFGKDDVYKAEDDMYIHHEYIDCPSVMSKLCWTMTIILAIDLEYDTRRKTTATQRPLCKIAVWS